MDESTNMDRLLLAVIRKDDYDETVYQLNSRGFFVTKLSSSGGFLKRENVTLMLGVEEARRAEAVDILKTCAGRRRTQTYVMPSPGTDLTASGLPVEVDGGGVTIFTLKLDGFAQY